MTSFVNHSVSDLFDALCARLGFDAAAVAQRTSFSGTIGRLGQERALLIAHNLLRESNHELALVQLSKLAADVEPQFRKFTDEPTPAALATFGEGLLLLAEIERRFTTWTAIIYPGLLQRFATPTLYAPDELTPEVVSPDALLDLKLGADAGHFRGLVRQPGTAPLGPAMLDYQLATNLVVTNDLARHLGSLSLALTTRVALFFVLEYPMEYSYFAFVIHYQDHAWLYTDAIDHANPLTKVSSRNPGRKVNEKLDDVALPYERLMEEALAALNVDAPVRPGQSGSLLHPVEIKTFFQTDEKLFLQTLIGALLRGLLTKPPTQRALTVGEYLAENRLLGTGELAIDALADYPEADFEGWDDVTRGRYAEILSGLQLEQGLVRVDPARFTQAVGQWITTPERFAGLVAWVALDAQREAVQALLPASPMESNNWSGVNELRKMFNAAAPRMLVKLAMADQFVWTFGPYHGWRGNPDADGMERHELVEPRIHTSFTKHYGATDGKCCVCRQRKPSHKIFISIPNWQVLVWLLDLPGRFDLPEYYRNFTCYDIYAGNSILNNVHPLARLKDYASESYKYGILAHVHCCKTCWKALRKQHYRAEVLDLNQLVAEAAPEPVAG